MRYTENLTDPACDEKHQPWPGRAAHTRHTAPDGAAPGRRVFRDAVDGAPGVEQTVILQAVKVRDQDGGL